MDKRRAKQLALKPSRRSAPVSWRPFNGDREIARRLRQQQRDANRQCDRADALGVEGGRVSRRGRVISVLRIVKEGAA